jgi:hypothetical protein
VIGDRVSLLLRRVSRGTFLLRGFLFACLDPLGEILFYDNSDFSHHHRVQPRRLILPLGSALLATVHILLG